MKKGIWTFGVMTALTTTWGAAQTEAMMLVEQERYDSGVQNEDGGTTEIVSYNTHNDMMYVVNGTTKKVEALQRGAMDKPVLSIDLAQALRDVKPDFTYGDLSSVSVSPTTNMIAVAVQAASYDEAGLAVILDAEGNILHAIEAGIQPDNITFTPDGTKILVANEGEPREGYDAPAVDPQGTITVIDVTNNMTAQHLTFEAFDTETARQQLVDAGVIMKEHTAPSVDLEPEYIAVAETSDVAYVALQENNAVATIDLKAGKIIDVKGLGEKDHSQPENALDIHKDDVINIAPAPYKGLYMPDGMAVYTVAGKNYIVTANEGDAREWGTHINEREIEIDGNEIVFFDPTEYDGVNKEAQYIFGGRSFSIFDAATMELVFDSGSDFERITAQRFPQHFNANNTNVKLDNRSGKKGPEPEDVKLGEVNGKIYAFIGLERIGGVMMYDITTPAQSKFVDYISTRDVSEDIAGDVSPEGLAFIGGDKPTLVVGHEVSGTVTTFAITDKPAMPAPTFTDISNNWAKASIERVYEAGLMKGVSSAKFAPQQVMTRAQVAVTLQRYTKGMVTQTPGVKDIPDNAHYASAVQWALYTRVLTATNEQVQPGKAITRADFAVALYEVLQMQGKRFTNEAASYTDIEAVTPQQRTAIAALQQAGIMQGNGDTFRPNGTMTRAHVATVLARLLEK